jgi:glucose/arabinose dehydrogenase
MKNLQFAGIILLLHFSSLPAQPQVQLELVADGLGYIVDIAHAGDDRLFILTRFGQIKIVQDGVVLPTPYLDISSQVTSGGEMGSLGLAFDPDFQNNGRFYVHYNAIGGGWWSRISRFTATSPEALTVDASTEQIVFSVSQPGTFHNGGDVDFGADGMLYMTLGDSFNAATSQDLTHPLGSIHRIDVSDGGDTYAIPFDNPYANSTGDTLKTIWAKGLRNPFRFGFDALTGDMWIGDVGSSAWEEVNFWPAGDHSGPNFGWRCFEGFVPASSPTAGCGPASQYVMPVAVQPTSGAWCSVIGGRVYRGATYPELYGRYLYSDYCAGVLHSLLPDGEGGWTNELLASGLGGSITCIGEDAALEMYLGRSNGSLYKITTPLIVGLPAHDKAALVVYPVPAQDHLMLEGISEAGTFEIFDQAGRCVAAGPLHGSGEKIDVRGLGNGSYVLVLQGASSNEMLRRVVTVVR